MRLLIASLFVFAGTGAFALWLLPHAPKWLPEPVAGVINGVVFLALCVVAMVLFSGRSGRASLFGSREDHLRSLEQQGLLESQTFQAVRAFQVEEFEDEGAHYFVELAEGGVLYLNSQELYEYEPDADAEEPQPRRFPCTQFTVLRHRTGGYLVDIECGGAPLEPEFLAPPFIDHDWKNDRVPADGEIIRDRSYDQLLQERRQTSARR